jgi:type VI secretion system protein ImpK
MSDTDDPFRPSDSTVVRPRPGGVRRPGPGETTPLPRTAASPVSPLPVPASVPAAPPAILAAGLSPLVHAAVPVLLMAGQIRSTVSVQDVMGLRRHATDEIRRFEERARASGTASETVVAARYALCASLDEAVLSTPWGHHSEWAQHNLLVALHREAWGGEKFFDMLERISADPARHIDLMELQYHCLALGFEGRYRVLDRGHERLAQVKHELFRQIRAHRGDPVPDLSLRWRGLEDRRNPIVRYVPWWVVGAAALAIVAITFTIYRARLNGATAPVYAALAGVGLEDFTRPGPAVVKGPTLKQLLGPEEARGVLAVEEEGGRTRVTLLANNLFASGSATISPDHEDTLRRVADAIRQVPGRVLVTGHTDDQPISSARFHDNFELSRERAVSVARIIQRGIADPARVEWNGAGSSQPLFRPESTPENRARNRRVEIVHVQG